MGDGGQREGCSRCWTRTDSSGCPFSPRKQPRGRTLYLEGERADTIWLVKSGSVALVSDAGEDAGAGKAVAVRCAGTLLGQEALLSPEYTHSAVIASDAVLCGASRDRVVEWLGPLAPARAALVQSIALAVVDERCRRIASGTALRRVAAWLLDGETIPVNTPRWIVADLLGIRAETLSRALRTLAKAGVIELDRTSIEILDRAALEETAARESV